MVLPFLSSIRVNVIGSMYTPWLAKLLNAPVGTSSVEEFKAFLECGLQGMEKLKNEGK